MVRKSCSVLGALCVVEGAIWVIDFIPALNNIPARVALICFGVLLLVGARYWPRKEDPTKPHDSIPTSRETDPDLPYPEPTTWVEYEAAFKIVRYSTLVVSPPDDSGIQRVEWIDEQHHRDVREQEMAAMHLEDFKMECPSAMLHGKYGREALQWWIGKRIADRAKIR